MAKYIYTALCVQVSLMWRFAGRRGHIACPAGHIVLPAGDIAWQQGFLASYSSYPAPQWAVMDSAGVGSATLMFYMLTDPARYRSGAAR